VAQLVVGQGGMGAITGTVVDSADAVVPNATVKVVQLSTNAERTTVTNEVGIFNLPSLVASNYTITITAPGMKEKKLENLTLNGFQTMTFMPPPNLSSWLWSYSPCCPTVPWVLLTCSIRFPSA